MTRSPALAVGLLTLLVPPSRADDPIVPDTVAAVKAATVYVRVEGEGWGGSGSGFVVAADPDRVLVVTNHHVAVKVPAGARPKPPAVSVVFGSGTATEQEYPATVAGADEDRDLAVLRVAGVKDAPRPIAYADPPAPVETMGVYSFGFPLGQALSGGKRFPAVTVGKASVSSLRDGDEGELAVVQIDGNLNPGNSGGPVVDAKGRLVGVAVARARDGQGIGFLVPAVEVGRLMAGRIGKVRVVPGAGAGGKPTARVEADVVDPAGAFRAVTAEYVIVPPKGKAPAGPLAAHPDARTLGLTVANGVAAGEFPAEPVGAVVVRVVGDRGAGPAPAATRPRAYPLAPVPWPESLTGPTPPGWTRYSSPGRPFVVWLPEKPAKQVEGERDVSLAGTAVRAGGVAGTTDDGLAYRAEVIGLPAALVRPAGRLAPALRTALREETGGQLAEVIEARVGDLPGVEYRFESGAEVTRVRVFVRGERLYAVRVTGPDDRVVGADAETILGTFRPPGASWAAALGRLGPLPPNAKVYTGGRHPVILGSIEHDPKFKTVGPDGAVLIGLEARFEKFGHTDIVRAVCPIYRVNGREEFGKQFGDDLGGAVTLKAKDGYAVGGITGKAGWWCNGFSLVFMRVTADGTLDSRDCYASEWVGFNGRGDVIRVLSDGAPVVGIVGKIVGPKTTALGLLYKGQEGFDPAAGKR